MNHAATESRMGIQLINARLMDHAGVLVLRGLRINFGGSDFQFLD